MKNSISYYNSKLDSVSIGRLFNILKFPNINPTVLIISSLFMTLLLSVVTGAIVLFTILLLVLLFEYYSVRSTRIKLLDVCLVDEILLTDDFEVNGKSKEFPDDPVYVTEADREYIFSDAVYQVSPPGIKETLKSHRITILNTMASFIICYLLLTNYIA